MAYNGHLIFTCFLPINNMFKTFILWDINMHACINEYAPALYKHTHTFRTDISSPKQILSH